MCTVVGQNDGHVLLVVGGDGHQHGRRLRGEETEGHVLSGLAALGVDGR